MASSSLKPHVDIRPHQGRPTVFIDDEPHPLAGYNFRREHVPLFSKHGMGVYLIGPPSIPGDYRCTGFWVGDEISSEPLVEFPPNVFTLDQQAELVLESDPDAYLIVRYVHRDPQSWHERHPEEYFITETGEVLGTPSLASDLFWEMAARYSTALIQYVESRPWSDRIIGYANFQYEEGTHRPVALGWLFDHSPAMLSRWQSFLTDKYGNIEALREAYRDPKATFETAEVPCDPLRAPLPDASQILYWQDREDNQALRDYLELTRDIWHQRFRQVGAAMDGAVDRKVIFLHDALKQTMLGWNLNGFFNYPSGRGEGVSWNPAYPELMAGSGHMSVTDLFDAPGCDGLLTPHDYQARGVGGVYEPEGIADSVVLRGKYFYGEMDQRVGDYEIGAARTPKELHAIVWRNFATSFTRGFNSYWMHGFHVDPWFEEEGIQRMVRRHIDVIKESIHWPHETVPGIAMILDDTAVLETTGAGNYFNEAIMWEQKMGIARCGVPHRIYLLEDLALDEFPPHRVFYFPNLFRVDEARLDLLREKVFRDGNIVVWGPGSGISDGETIGAASASTLTGFEFDLISANAQRRILIANFDHPITGTLDPATIIGGPLPYGPVIMPTDGLELGIAWAKGGFNHIGLALKEFGGGAAGPYTGTEPLGAGDYAALFTTAVPLPADLWRNLARYAGAHVYSEVNDITLANKSMVALHSLRGGEKRIALPGTFDVRDVISGEQYAQGTSEIRFDLDPPETRVFLLEP